MSLKQEIETWVQALEHYDRNEYDAALRAFMTVADTSKILFNCGVIHATLGEHTQAVQCYQRAVHFDQYMAIAYFQQGVSNFLLGDFEEALANFNDTLLYLRGNRWIDYDQLGLKFKLHSCEALFNRGLCYIYLQQRSAGLQDLFYASKEKAVPDHDVIDEAIREQAEGYTVFSIPVGTVYRPNEAKVKNIKSKNYLGTSTLVRAQDTSNRIYMDPRRNLTASSFAVDDRPEEKLSYAAINLVKPGLASRSRQQSEPPIHRNLFPPTPPPEVDAPSRRKSGESATRESTTIMHQNRPSISKPAKLDLGVAAFDHTNQSSTSLSEKPRLGTKRCASERPRTREAQQQTPQPSKGQENRNSASLPMAAETAVLKPDVYTPNSDANLQPTTQNLLNAEIVQSISLHHRRTRSGGQSLREYPLSIAEEEEEEEEENTNTTSNTNHESTNLSIPPPIPSAKPHELPSSTPLKLRTKLHTNTETRYLLCNPNTSFPLYLSLITKKLKYENPDKFKLKIKDEEGDFVTLGDEDDWDMVVQMAGEKSGEVGKIEVWVVDV